MLEAAILIAVVSFVVWKKFCARASPTAHAPMIETPMPQQQQQPQPQPQPQMQPPLALAPSAPAYEHHQNPIFNLSKLTAPGAHLYLSKGRACPVFFTVLFRTLDFYVYTIICIYFYFHNLCLILLKVHSYYFYLYTFTFRKIYSPYCSFTFTKENTPPQKGRDITHDIFFLK